MTDAADVVTLLSERRAMRGLTFETARLISQQYNNEIAVPLPETTSKEMPAVANFIAQGIDQHGMRIASVMPDLDFPMLKDSKKSETQSLDRRRAAFGWLEGVAYDLLSRKRARHLIAYRATPVQIVPDMKNRKVDWKVRSPLDTYSAPTSDPLDFHPANSIFTFTRPWKWVQRAYPNIAAYINSSLGNAQNQPKADDLVEFAEYTDEYETILVCTGKGSVSGLIREAEFGIGDARIINLGMRSGPSGWAMEVDRSENLAGCATTVVPARVSLDESRGQFDDTPGLFQMLSKMMSLEINAVSRAVFPDTWFTRDNSGTGRIIRPADGLLGIVGEVEGGQVNNLAMTPGFETKNTISMLERGLRLNGALPAEFGGEAASNIRTDRRGQSVLSAAVDYHIDEHQKILARSLKAEIGVAAEIEKAYWGKDKKSFYVSWGKKPGRVDYVPNVLWDGDCTVIVSYPFAGMDINEITVAIGQQVGIKAMSKETAMETLATVDDPKKEKRRIAAEDLETALIGGIQQRLASGEIPEVDGARILQLIRYEDMDVADAVAKAHEEAQQRQAGQQPEAAPGAPPVDPAQAAAAAQPGLANPGAGAEVPQGGPEAPEGLKGLRQLLGGLTAGRSLVSPGGQ